MTTFGSKQAPAATPSRNNRYAGIACDDGRADFLPFGTHRVEILGAKEGRDGDLALFKVKIPEGEHAGTYVVVFKYKYDLGKMKSLAVAASGVGVPLGVDDFRSKAEAEARYDSLEVELGGGLGCILRDTVNGADTNANLAGQYAVVVVTKGNPMKSKDTGEPTGDYYRACKWYSPDSEDGNDPNELPF